MKSVTHWRLERAESLRGGPKKNVAEGLAGKPDRNPDQECGRGNFGESQIGILSGSLAGRRCIDSNDSGPDCGPC